MKSKENNKNINVLEEHKSLFAEKMIKNSVGVNQNAQKNAKLIKKVDKKRAKNAKTNQSTQKEQIITSESVNIGHPDKTCDVIADAFLDEALRQDKNSQMAVECAIKNNKLFIYGEATTQAKIDYDKIARNILKDIGYKCDFDIIKEISEQSPEINRAVVQDELAANDQGICFGYATNETPELMPLPIIICHKLMQKYDSFRRKTSRFFADAKCQVSVKYVNNKPKEITTILLSCSHAESLDISEIKNIIIKKVVNPVLKEYKKYCGNMQFIINPSGKFTIWGSFGDSGCVGRKNCCG